MALPILLLVRLLLIAADVGPEEQTRLLSIAHRAIERQVEGKPPEATAGGPSAEPVFVTIERSGVVIGCRGDLTPRTASLDDEVAQEARAACAHDPRYRPLSVGDLRNLLVTVTIVHGQDRIESVDGLQPGDGLVLESNGRTGVVLPWEGKDPQIRLDWAYRKAGVSKSSPVVLFRLRAERFRG